MVFVRGLRTCVFDRRMACGQPLPGCQRGVVKCSRSSWPRFGSKLKLRWTLILCQWNAHMPTEAMEFAIALEQNLRSNVHLLMVRGCAMRKCQQHPGLPENPWF